MEKRITAALRFETLEPRLLLSAQVLHVDPSHVGGDWAVQIDAATHSVQILDEQQGGAAVVQQYSAPANGSVEIDASQNDHVVVEVASLPATPGAPAPNLDWIELSGQAGDTLAAPGTSDQWAINGQGKGTLDGLQFVGFTRLEDASGSNDTFVWQPNGPVSMAIVGVGSGDSATIEGNGFENIGVTTNGPQSGAVAIDGSTLDFAGLGGISIDPIEAEKEVVANVTVTAPAAGDDLVLKTATNNAQQLTFESLKNSSPSITFFKPSESLTVDATGADDTVSVNTLSLSGASLTINAPNVGTVDAGNTVNLGSISTGGGALTVNNGPSGPLFAVFSLDDKIAVNNASTISTRDVNASGAVVGDAGNITLNGTDVDLGTGSKLDASAGGSFTAGDVTLSANYQVIATGFVLDNITNNFVPRAASITLGQNASIDGGTIDLGATAGDQNVNGLVNAEAGGFNFMKPLENFAAFLSLPVSVLGKSSDAEIAIGQDASIDATSDLIVDAQAQSLATGNAIYWFSGGAANTGGLAVVYDETDATANVDIASGAHLVADGNASVVSDATSKAAGIARVSQNTGAFPTNPQNVQFSVAVGLSALTSHVTVAAGAEINSGKNAAVRALGVSGNSQQAETASYGDGLVGIDGSLVFTNNDVKATVDGTVIAKGAAVDPQFTFNPFSAVNTATNTFNLGNVAGVQTGDAFTYSSGLGGAIGGLTDGQVYYAIRIPANSTSIELAATQADALAGKAIQLQPLPTLINTQTKQTYQFSNVDVTNDAIDLGQNWAGGGLVPMVAYIAAPGQQIGGLVSGKTYIVRPVAGNPQEIQLWDAFTLKPVNLDINPTVTTANGQSFDFGINETPDDLIFSSAPGFAKGQALVYHQALGLQIDGLVDGQTYYAIPVPNEDGSPGVDPTLFRLAATQADALASDGYTNVIDISTDDSTYESGDAHTLTPIAKTGVSVEALLTTVDKSIAKSGIGSEPKIRDAISKGELFPAFGAIFANLANIATGPGGKNPIESNIKANTPAGSGSNVNFTLAAGLGFLKSENNVVAEIGPDAILQSGTNVSVTATLSHKMQVAAEGRVSKASDAPGAAFAVGGAADVDLAFDTAQALVDSGAQIDASGAVNVTSDVEYPFLTALGSPNEYGQALLDKLKADPTGTLATFVGRTLFIQDQFLNSWTRATGKNPKGGVSVAGAVNFEDFETTSQAIVSSGARINQNPAFQNPAQSVAVNAVTDLKRIDMDGIFDIELSPDGLAKMRRKGDWAALYEPFGTQGATGGLGGAFNFLVYDTTTQAEIGDGAKVRAGADGGVSVNSTQNILAVELLQSGAEGGKFGVAGAISYVTGTSDTEASVGSGVTISAPSVAVQALDDSFLFSLTGSVFKAGSIGFGASGTVYNLDRTTLAYVGDPTGLSTAGDDIELGPDGTLTIEATTTGTVVALSFAAGTAGSDPMPSGGQSSLPTQDAGQGNPGVSTGSFGLAVSGAVSFTSTDETTKAFIDDPGTIQAGSVDVAALNDSLELSAAGSAAVSKGDGSANAGLAGAYGEVDLSGATQAYINRATIQAKGDVNVTADRTGHAFSLVAGGSGSSRYNGVAVTGSAAVNRQSQDTLVELDKAKITAGGKVNLNAVDALSLSVIAGALSFGGKFGFGASVAYNFVDSSVRAKILNSAITAGGVSVRAARGEGDAENPTPQIIAVAGSLGAGSSGAAAAGTIAVNFIEPNANGQGVQASVQNSNVNVTGATPLAITADGAQGIVVIAGGVASGKQAAFGVAVAYNEITAPVVSSIDGGAINAAGGVEITADSQSRISSVALGVALAGQNVAAAGSASANVIEQPIMAIINGGATVNSQGAVNVEATETSAIDGAAGSAAFASQNAAIGAAIVTNTLADATAATIDGSTVSANTVTVEALSTQDQITAVAAGGEGSGGFAAGASVAINTIRNVTTAALQNGAVIANARAVTIHAGESGNTYTASAGNIALAKNAAVGVAVATNDIATTIEADVTGKATKFGLDVGTVDISADRVGALNLALAVGGAGAQNFALAGSVATEKDKSAIVAEAAGGVSLAVVGAVSIDAEDHGNTNTVTAGSVAGAKTAAIGAAAATADLAPTVLAGVTEGTSATSDGTVDIDAQQSGDKTIVLAVGGAGAQTFAAGASVATVVSRATIEGSVDSGSRVAAPTIDVTAQQTGNNLNNSGGGVAGAQSAAIGAAVVVNDLADIVEARILGAIGATNNRAITVAANVDANTTRAIAVGGAGAQTFAAGGSVAVTKLGGTTEAVIADGAQITTPGSLSISANRVTNAQTIGGAIAGAGTAAVGIGNATLLSTEETLATVGKAAIQVGGAGAGLTIKTGVDGEIVSVNAFKGFSLTATAEDDLQTIAAGGSLAGTAAIAGSAAVTQTDETTTAILGATNPSASNFNVFAANVTNSTSGGGALGGAGTVGVGAGADVATIGKTTEAEILSAALKATGNVYLQALSQEGLSSFAGSASFAGKLSLAGAASVFVLDLTTEALVGAAGSPAGISSDGNVLIAANDQTTLNQFAGTVGAAGLGTVGASAAVATVNKTTEALVASGSTVTALASPSADAISAALGTFDVTYTAPSGSPDDVQPPNVQIDLKGRTGDPNQGNVNDPALTKERQANEEYGSTRGVAITAVNQDDLKSFDIGAGLSPVAAISLAAGVDVVNATTEATIADGAKVTAGQGASAPGDGSVDVIASDDFFNLGLAGALAIGGKFGASPGVDSSIVDLTTVAKVGAATVSASRDVIVQATATEDILSITGGLAASGLVALSAGAGVVDIENETLAQIGANANVAAGGNVGVLASDETEIVNAVGQAAVGIGAVGVGASAAVTLVNKDTEANIGAGAVVNADAEGPNTIEVPTGLGTGPVFPTKNLKGVAIVSNSTEDVTAVSVSGGGGLLAGVGGGATYTAIDATTHTTVASGAKIRAGSLGPAAGAGSIAVDSLDAVQALDVGGGFGVGGAGIGGGVDVGIIRNDTATSIASGAQLQAKGGTLDLLALSYQGVTSYAVSGGGGAVGVAGAVSVWTLGGTFASSYKTGSGSNTNALGLSGGNQPTSALGYADRQTDRTDVLDLLGSYKSAIAAPGSDNTSLVNAIAAAAAGDLKASQPVNVVEKEAASTRQTGTSVSVASGASIVADGSILMGAGQTIRSNITAGGGAIGIVGLGGSVGILNVNEHTSVNFDGAAWTGGDFLASAATLSSENVNAYGGQAGLVAVGAQVALLSDTGTVSATMGPDAKVERAGAVTLRAWRNFDSIKANAKGGAVGGLAGGAAVANITIGGSAAATVDGSTIGATSGSQVRDLLVQARFTADATADTIAVAGGIGSGVGNVSTVTLNPTVSAIAEGVNGKGLIGLTGDLTVDTNSTAIGHAIGEGRAYGGVGVGVNNTTATTNATTESLLQNGISVSARNVSVIAHSNDVADANGQANAGGSLIGVTAANSTATDTSTTLAQILKTQPVNASGNVTVSATNDKSDATAEARGINAPGFAVGVSAANATATPDVFAGVTDATINAGGNVSITAKFGSSGMSGASAQAYGSVGALPAGAVLTANTSETQTVLVFATLGYFESPSRTTTSQITAGGDVTISADSTTKSNATANNTGNGFFFSTGNAQAKASTTVSTQAFVGSGGKIKAGRTLAITASEGDTMDYVASGATGGTIPLGSATASGNLNRTPNVLVGNDVTLDADTISLLATVRSTTVNGNAAWESKGLGGNAFPHASFTLGGGVNLFVGRAALTARVVNINATDNEDVRVRSYGDVQGLGGLIDGKATIDAVETVTARVDSAATIRGTQKVTMHAGFGRLVDETNVHEFLGTFAGTANVISTVNVRGSVFLGPENGSGRTNIITPSFVHSVTPSTVRSLSATYRRDGTPLRGGSITDFARDSRSIKDDYPPSSLAGGDDSHGHMKAASALTSGDVCVSANGAATRTRHDHRRLLNDEAPDAPLLSDDFEPLGEFGPSS